MSENYKALEDQYKKTGMAALAAAVCLLLAIALIFFNVPFAFLMFVIAACIHLFLFRPNRKKYDDAVNKANLECTICRMLKAAPPEPVGSSYITARTLTESDLLPPAEGSEPLFCWEMHGKRKGFTISLCDATTWQKYITLAGKSRFNTSSGVFCVFDLPKDSNRHFLIMDKEFLPDSVREMHMDSLPQYTAMPLSDPELSEDYFFYSAADDAAHTLPVPFGQSIKRLMKYTPGFLGISVKQKEMYVFVNARFVSHKVSVSRPITQKDLEYEAFPELSYLIDIAASLQAPDLAEPGPEETPAPKELPAP